MKKTLHLVTLFLIASWSAYGQDFVQVTQSDLQHQVKLSQNQALEVRLPSTPSSGFGWYPANSNAMLKQVGNWEFVSDNPANSVGASGTQVNHFVSTASGTTELELLYKRPWEDASQATASYKVTVVSEGAYIGVEVKPYIAATVDASNTVEKNESTLALPAAFSWAGQNLCTPVKNQAQCGSCWAFAACGSFEAVIKIWDNVTRDMAEQWLVNCTSGMDCGGGMFPGSMFTGSKGAVYEPDQPYTGANGTCKSSYTYHEKPVGYKQLAVTPTSAQIKQAIYDYGPVWAVIDAGNNFQNYKNGVFSQSDGTQFDHAIVLCGWDDATSSWVLRNSWGASWGESGYMRIKYGTSVVGDYATYWDYKGTVIDHNATGIVDVNHNSSIQVFPNPSNGVFTFSGLENENTIQVYDFVGNVVYQTTSKNPSVTVDMKEKSQGMYMYKVINTATKGVKAGKLMVY